MKVVTAPCRRCRAALSGTEDQRTFAPELHARLQNMESMLAHLNGVLSSLNQVRVEDLRSQATSWLSCTGDDVDLPDEPFTFQPRPPTARWMSRYYARFPPSSGHQPRDRASRRRATHARTTVDADLRLRAAAGWHVQDHGRRRRRLRPFVQCRTRVRRIRRRGRGRTDLSHHLRCRWFNTRNPCPANTNCRERVETLGWPAHQVVMDATLVAQLSAGLRRSRTRGFLLREVICIIESVVFVGSERHCLASVYDAYRWITAIIHESTRKTLANSMIGHPGAPTSAGSAADQ
jgi:hypothetical protein